MQYIMHVRRPECAAARRLTSHVVVGVFGIFPGPAVSGGGEVAAICCDAALMLSMHARASYRIRKFRVLCECICILV